MKRSAIVFALMVASAIMTNVGAPMRVFASYGGSSSGP